MTYTLLAHGLHDTADRAKKYFAENHSAKSFVCEKELEDDLPLRPTWQASLQGGYRLCVEVLPSPFTQSLWEFVTRCAQLGIPVRLWVAIPGNAAESGLTKELKQAKGAGVGVVQFDSESGNVHEFHRPVALSLFGLRRIDLSHVAKAHRASIKAAEDTFLDGDPDAGCQKLCQDLESVSRRVAQFTYNKKWWATKSGLKDRFFTIDAWVTMLEKFDVEIDVGKVRKKSAGFKKSNIAAVRNCTDWRNALSHKPKTYKQVQERDQKLRTIFESTRQTLIDWLALSKELSIKIDL